MGKGFWRFYFRKRKYSDTKIYILKFYGVNNVYTFRFNKEQRDD